MRRVLLIVAAAAFALVAGGVACSSTSTTSGITPPSGILVRSETLVAGLGCGNGPSQVFKFAAAVTNDDGATLGGATYDCFADASFQNLPPSSNGSFHYKVSVFVYDRTTYQGSAGAIEASAADPTRLATLPSTWSTTCEATQQADVEVFAVCAPLAKTGTATQAVGSVRIPTDSFVAANDGGTLACGTNYTSVVSPPVANGTSDAGSDAASDATSDATSDASTDAGSDAAPTSSNEVSCPSPLLFGGLAAPAPFQTTIQLLFAGIPVGTTTCRATTQPGAEVTATCDPIAK